LFTVNLCGESRHISSSQNFLFIVSFLDGNSPHGESNFAHWREGCRKKERKTKGEKRRKKKVKELKERNSEIEHCCL
jgi:hypothetical protein